MVARSAQAPAPRTLFVPNFIAPVGNTVVCELARISVASNGPMLMLNLMITAVGPGDSLATPNFSSTLIDTGYRVREGNISPVTANTSSKQSTGAAVGTFANDVSFVPVQLSLPEDDTAGLDLVASNAGVAELVGDLAIRYWVTPGNP